MATAARRNGSPAKRAAKRAPAKRGAQRPAAPPGATPEPEQLTTEERLDRLEQGLAGLGAQLRQFMAQQLLQDPRVQEMLQQQIAARLGQLPQEPPR